MLDDSLFCFPSTWQRCIHVFSVILFFCKQEFSNIIRRAFATRLFPPEVVDKLGENTKSCRCNKWKDDGVSPYNISPESLIKVMTLKQILLLGTSENVKRTVWRICILILGCKGLKPRKSVKSPTRTAGSARGVHWFGGRGEGWGMDCSTMKLCELLAWVNIQRSNGK